MLNRAKLDQLLDRYGSLVWNKWNAPEDAVHIGRGSLIRQDNDMFWREKRGCGIQDL